MSYCIKHVFNVKTIVYVCNRILHDIFDWNTNKLYRERLFLSNYHG